MVLMNFDIEGLQLFSSFNVQSKEVSFIPLFSVNLTIVALQYHNSLVPYIMVLYLCKNQVYNIKSFIANWTIQFDIQNFEHFLTHAPLIKLQRRLYIFFFCFKEQCKLICFRYQEVVRASRPLKETMKACLRDMGLPIDEPAAYLSIICMTQKTEHEYFLYIKVWPKKRIRRTIRELFLFF